MSKSVCLCVCVWWQKQPSATCLAWKMIQVSHTLAADLWPCRKKVSCLPLSHSLSLTLSLLVKKTICNIYWVGECKNLENTVFAEQGSSINDVTSSLQDFWNPSSTLYYNWNKRIYFIPLLRIWRHLWKSFLLYFFPITVWIFRKGNVFSSKWRDKDDEGSLLLSIVSKF